MDNNKVTCIWACEDCDEENCEHFYCEDMELDDTDRKAEFAEEWLEYIRGWGE